MPTANDFTIAVQADITDSLADARDNHESAMAALADDGESQDTAAHFAYVYGSVYYRFIEGKELSVGDLQMIASALEMSIETCMDLGDDLKDAEASYRAAREAVQAIRFPGS